MCHFLIVNTTQKAVDAAIEQQIVARLTSMINFEKTPILPRWIRRQVEKGEDNRALAIAQYLNTATGSPWKGKILMGKSRRGRARVDNGEPEKFRQIAKEANPRPVESDLRSDVERREPTEGSVELLGRD
jgi:hypothetical protein